jgi:hypothetical protein
MALEGFSRAAHDFWQILMWWMRSQNLPHNRKLAAMFRSSTGNDSEFASTEKASGGQCYKLKKYFRRKKWTKIGKF